MGRGQPISPSGLRTPEIGGELPAEQGADRLPRLDAAAKIRQGAGMRGIELQGAFGEEHLALVERSELEPGAGEIRVRVSAASLNYRDLLMVRGQYNPKQSLPLVPASDGVGVVDAVGADVHPRWVGKRVAGMFAQGWISGPPDHAAARATLGGPLDGMLQDSILLRADGVAVVPDHLSDAEAATLPCAGLTAWSALHTLGGVAPGDVVLVQGSGGVSSFAIDFARAAGARVIATTRAPGAKEAYLRERGADEVVVTQDDPRWGKTVRALTGGRGVDVVVEVGGAGTLGQSLRAVRMGGRVAMIGVLAGGKAEVDMTPVLMGQVRVQGVLVGHRHGFEAMCRAIAHHEIRPAVDRTFALEQTREAFAHLASGDQRGKICVRVGSDDAES